MWAAEPSFTNEELRSIEAPTLLVIGDRDIVTPEHAVEMFRTIADAQLCVVPNAAHGTMPEETVLTFLRGRGHRREVAAALVERHSRKLAHRTIRLQSRVTE